MSTSGRGKTKGQVESLRHEKRLESKYEGGQRSAASGAFWSRKGDVRSRYFLFEHKWTEKKSLSIKAEWLIKVAKEAIMESKIPVLAFHLCGRNYVILSEDDFDELWEKACGRTGHDA